MKITPEQKLILLEYANPTLVRELSIIAKSRSFACQSKIIDLLFERKVLSGDELFDLLNIDFSSEEKRVRQTELLSLLKELESKNIITKTQKKFLSFKKSTLKESFCLTEIGREYFYDKLELAFSLR